MSNATIEAVVEESTWSWTYDDNEDKFYADFVKSTSFELWVSDDKDDLYLFVGTSFSGDNLAKFTWYLNADEDPVVIARNIDEVVKRLV